MDNPLICPVLHGSQGPPFPLSLLDAGFQQAKTTDWSLPVPPRSSQPAQPPLPSETVHRFHRCDCDLLSLQRSLNYFFSMLQTKNNFTQLSADLSTLEGTVRSNTCCQNSGLIDDAKRQTINNFRHQYIIHAYIFIDRPSKMFYRLCSNKVGANQFNHESKGKKHNIWDT